MKNIYGYNYQKKKRPEGYIPPSLSEKDEYIPKTHIGMYTLIRNPKNEAIYMGEEQCQNVRKKTFNSVLAIFREYGSPDYADLWNYNISAINDCGLNYFICNPKIAPVGDLIECFEEVVETNKGKARISGNKALYISFGINKALLVQYFKNRDEANKSGTEVRIPKLKPPGSKSRESVLFGEETFTRKDGGTIVIPRNALYNRFRHWCKLQGIGEGEGLLMALETLFKCYPVDGLQESEYYNIVTELDRMAFRQRLEKGEEEVTATLSKVIYGKAKEIIARYNIDPDNLSKGQMTFDTYVNNSLYLLNSKMPFKYSDPDFVKEQEDTEKLEKEV